MRSTTARGYRRRSLSTSCARNSLISSAHKTCSSLSLSLTIDAGTSMNKLPLYIQIFSLSGKERNGRWQKKKTRAFDQTESDLSQSRPNTSSTAYL